LFTKHTCEENRFLLIILLLISLLGKTITILLLREQKNY
jgi:hypothetical protein